MKGIPIYPFDNVHIVSPALYTAVETLQLRLFLTIVIETNLSLSFLRFS